MDSKSAKVGILILLNIFLCLADSELPPAQSADFAANVRNAGQAVSKVRITVGETNFLYSLSGYTVSNRRISVSGEYFNDATNGAGYAHLYLGVEPGVYDYRSYYPAVDTLNIDVVNGFGDVFSFQVVAPYPVGSNELGGGRFNATALIVTGPSRSAIGYGRSQPKGVIVPPPAAA